MKIPIYKSIYKEVLWAGIPRNYLIFIAILTLLSLMVFRTPKAIFPILLIYFILVAITRFDPNYISILKRNLQFKDSYFPD